MPPFTKTFFVVLQKLQVIDGPLERRVFGKNVGQKVVHCRFCDFIAVSQKNEKDIALHKALCFQMYKITKNQKVAIQKFVFSVLCDSNYVRL